MNNMIVIKDANGKYQAFDKEELLKQVGQIPLDGGLNLSDAMYLASKVSYYMAVEKINHGNECYSHCSTAIKEPNIIWPEGVTHAALVRGELIFAEVGNYIQCRDQHSSMDSGPTSWSIEEVKPSEKNHYYGERVRTIGHSRDAPVFSRVI